jgi:hypothetical protein
MGKLGFNILLAFGVISRKDPSTLKESIQPHFL